jgi:TusA-related sulfurtransferase/predicted peroxiredoxin
MSEEKQKLVYVLHDAGEKAEKVLTAFTLANIGVTMEHEVTIVLFGEATRLAYKGYAETVHAVDRQPMSKLMSDFLESGGKILICMPCLKARKVEPSVLINGVETITGTVMNDVILKANKVIGW